MNPWAWYRNRSWGVRLAVGLPAAAFVLAFLYVVARWLQYASDKGTAGAFAPEGADVVIRARDLEASWERIRETPAWRTIERKILKDTAVRKTVNDRLAEASLPTLDDLQDVRKMGRDLEANVMRAAGRDFMAAVEGTHFCAATRLRFTDFLAAPLAGFALQSETAAGRTCLRVQNFYVVVVGSFAVVSDDKALLEAALKQAGGTKAPAGVVEARFNLEDRDASPWLDLRGAAVAEASLDAADSAIVGTVAIEGAAWTGAEPPVDYIRMAPVAASGFGIWSVDLRQVYDRLLKTYVADKNVGEGLRTLEKAGLRTSFLPLVGSGMAFFSGAVESGNRLYPGVAGAFPSMDSKAAASALDAVMEKSVPAERFKRESYRSGDAEIVVWRVSFYTDSPWQTLCYAALPGVFLLGNNETFLDSVANASGGNSLMQQGSFRALERRAGECGLEPLGTSPGAVLFPAALKESLDGFLSRIATNDVDKITDNSKLRAEVEADFRKQGRRVDPNEVKDAYEAAKAHLYRKQEDELRDALRPLDFVKWAAVQSAADAKGLKFKVVLDLR